MKFKITKLTFIRSQIFYKLFFFLILLLILNLGISCGLKYLSWFNNLTFYTLNFMQETFRFGYWSAVIIPFLWLIFACYLQIYKNYSLAFVVILAGLISNILERLWFGFVADYFNFGIGIANLADLQIYGGVVYVLITIAQTKAWKNTKKKL